jgi:hypothetical protein
MCGYLAAQVALRRTFNKDGQEGQQSLLHCTTYPKAAIGSQRRNLIGEQSRSSRAGTCRPWRQANVFGRYVPYLLGFGRDRRLGPAARTSSLRGCR